jgi:hypothetical protein
MVMVAKGQLKWPEPAEAGEVLPLKSGSAIGYLE